MRTLRLTKECVENIRRIQQEEEESGVDACNLKLRELWLDGVDIEGLEYDGFHEPNKPYGIYLYDDELVVIIDGIDTTYKVVIED